MVNILTKILDERIEQLDINEDSNLEEINSIYFSNVQYIHFCLNRTDRSLESYANIIMKIFKN
jgi:hypothetical protein